MLNRKISDADWFLIALVLAGFAGLLMAAAVQAANVTLTWAHPTEYVDNSPLPPSEIQATELAWGACNEPPQVVASTQGSLTSYTVQALGRGEWCFFARTVVVGGERGAWSDPALLILTTKPKAPALSVAASGNLAVVIE